jgi:predicted glycoside hydrolase/deacetylase ChbG (UPF0249 family)
MHTNQSNAPQRGPGAAERGPPKGAPQITLGARHHTAERLLIVNADDFGQSPGINNGIREAHEQGIVRSASLMVRWPAAAEAAAYGRDRSDFSLGLHVDLGEWAFRGESWAPVYEVAPLEDRAAVAEEVRRQLGAFRRLAGRDPTHLDSHQHVHLSEPMRSVLAQCAQELGVPLRNYSRRVRYCGDFYGQGPSGEPYPEGIRVEGLIALLKALPVGLTELGCHPGDASDLDSMYRAERAQEVATLCDPRVRAALAAEGIELRSFRGVHGP